MQEQEKPSFVTRFKAIANRFWTDRELIVRSDGHVRYLKFSRTVQTILLLPGLVALGGAGYVGYQYVMQERVIANHKEDLSQSRLAYLDLMSEVAEYQHQFSTITRELESNQAYLLGVLEQNANLRKDLDIIQGKVKDTNLDRSQMAIVRETLKRRLDDFETDLNDATSENQNLETHVYVLRQRLETTETERDVVVEVRDALEDKIKSMRSEKRQLVENKRQLEDSLADLKNTLDIKETNIASLTESHDLLTEKFTKTDKALQDSTAKTTELSAKLLDTQTKLDESRQKNTQLLAQNDELSKDLTVSRKDLATAHGKALSVELALEKHETSLRTLIEERSVVEEDRQALTDKVAALETHLSDVHDSQTELLLKLAERTHKNLSYAEKSVAMAGLDVEQLLQTAISKRSAKGGPYVKALANLDMPKEYEQAVIRLGYEMERWETLQKLLQALPLAAPVDQYRLTSGFGKRVDPINRRPAFHYGLDFAASVKTAIYAPAQGKVTYAGWKGSYGRFVEIDHGFGLKTRYGHLHSINVKKGQKVSFRDRIARLGNSGRSTGPHLHYEVTLNGRPINPKKFLSAGRYVFKK